MEIEIERVVPEDSKEFLRVYKEAYSGLEEYAYREEIAIKGYFRWLYHRDPSGFFKAKVDGEVVAFLACDCNWYSKYEGREVAEVHEIFVLPKYQGRGIGKALMKKAEEYGKERGRDLMELWVGIGNEKARRFYESLGFQMMEVKGIWIRMRKRIERGKLPLQSPWKPS